MVSGRGDKKHVGVGSHGKGSGTGAMTDIEPERVPDNMVLSNRDKAAHSKARGQDGKAIETEQLQDHAANRYPQKER
ncbi:MAG TPA: hypothetical protein VEC60_09765 [Reyranella sp.]|nr:hypothetical protein [Reyranella sp.]